VALELEKILGTDTGKEAFYKSDRNFDRIKDAMENVSGDAVDINYDNAESELEAENVQDAVDELKEQINSLDANKVDNSRVLTNVPVNAKFTDTITTINGKTGAISKADIVALGIPAQDTTYSEITTSEIDAGTSSTLRTITGRRVKYILDKVQGWIGNLTKADVGLDSVDNVKQATKVEFDEHKADGSSHSKTARFVVGTSIAGWTAADCDYLCDGTNDQEEIIQALNDLPATGGEVVILDGTYNITASINIPKDNVSIRGSGNATTLKRMYNSTNTDSGATAKGLITLNKKSGCKIQGLQIDGNKATYTGSYNYGIYLYSSSDNTVTGNTCNNNSYGIRLYSSSSNNTVTGNTCNNSSYGIYLSSSSNNTVTGNTCNNNSYGIRLDSSSSNNTVTGNTCNNNSSYGISLSSSSNNTVTGNTCNNSSYGISLYSSSDNTVTGNTCNNNSSDGIYLGSSNSNTVTGNTCNNNSNYGIRLYSSSSNNTVTGNTCIRGTGQPSDYTSSQYTIHLSGSGNNYNLISSNNCMGKAPVVEGGTGNSAWGNKFDNTDDLP
jgi:parallel beta-helix repeat protein